MTDDQHEHTAASAFNRRTILKTGAIAAGGAATTSLFNSDILRHIGLAPATQPAQASGTLSVATVDFEGQEHVYTDDITDIDVVLDINYAYQASVEPEDVILRLDIGQSHTDLTLADFHQDGDAPLSASNTVTLRSSLQSVNGWTTSDFNLDADETERSFELAMQVSLEIDGPDGQLLAETESFTRTLDITRPEDAIDSFDISGHFEVDEDE